MDIEEKAQRENPLMNRIEVEFVLHHPGEKTPERDSVRNLIADYIGGDPESTIIDRLESEFGRASTRGYAKIYESAEEARRIESQYLLERNNLTEA